MITQDEFFCIQALECLGLLVSNIPSSRIHVDSNLVYCAFRGGLTTDLIECLKILIAHISSVRSLVQVCLMFDV